ncbi:MAG: hypothetical protein ABI435_00350 [Pseudolysinimonas sp.]
MTDNIFGDDANAPADVPIPEAEFIDPAAAVPAAVDNIVPDPIDALDPLWQGDAVDAPPLTPQQEEAAGNDVPVPPAAEGDAQVEAPPLPDGIDGAEPVEGALGALPPALPDDGDVVFLPGDVAPMPPVQGAADVPPAGGGVDGENPAAPPVPPVGDAGGQDPFPVQGQPPVDDVGVGADVPPAGGGVDGENPEAPPVPPVFGVGDPFPVQGEPPVDVPGVVEVPVGVVDDGGVGEDVTWELGDSVGGVIAAITGTPVTDESIAQLLSPEQIARIEHNGGRIDAETTESLLEQSGIPATIVHGDIDQLQAWLDAGIGTVVSLDGTEIGKVDGGAAAGADVDDPNFMAMVTKVDTDAGLVWLNSSGDVDGDVFSVALAAFMDAWEDSDFLAIKSDQTAHEWHAAHDVVDVPPVVVVPPVVDPPGGGGEEPFPDGGDISISDHMHGGVAEDGTSLPDGTPAPTALPTESADAPVLNALTQNPWIVIPGVLAVGGAAAAILAARKMRRS